jgi:asparaginyl-tRNA synthetase
MCDNLDFQNETKIAIIKIRAKLLHAARCWCNQNDYVEVHGPTIIPAVGDWPSSFEVKYFDKKAYLVQGLQPYANSFVASLGKIYTIAPAFRAEKLSTRRHLTEYWRIEVAQQCDLDRLIGFEEAMVEHVCQSLSKQTPETLSCFQRSTEDFAKVKAPFPKLTYDEAVDLLQSDGFNVNWGQKLSWKMEKHLSLKFTIPFFITKFPLSIETFFNKSDPERPELTLSADLLAPEGYGEIGSSVQRITDKNVLSQKMTEENIDPKDQKWCLNFMPNNSLPHSGFAIGVERLIQWTCKLTHVKEATAFPRLPDHVYP